jgi:hypothetical protein
MSTTLLVTIALVLFVLVIFQLARTMDYVSADAWRGKSTA